MKRLAYLDSSDNIDLDDIELIEKLRRRLNNSRSEMYCGLKDMKGSDCAFVIKARERFEEYDLGDIRDLILDLARRLEKYHG